MSIVKNQQVADQWVEGLAGNWTILERLSSPTMRVWHSHDNIWLTREEGAARMASSESRSSPPVFEDVRAMPTPNGFIVQGSIAALGAAGKTHIIQVLTVEDGKIAACEEYIAPEMSLEG